MSTTTAPAAITVPLEFLPEFAAAATVSVMTAAQMNLSLDFSDEARRQDDVEIAGVRRALDARDAILQAFDHGSPVPIDALRACANEALQDLRDRLGSLLERRDDSRDPDAERIAAKAVLLRDMSAWRAEIRQAVRA